jgi:hypothetical protein
MTTWRGNPAKWSTKVLIGIFVICTMPSVALVSAQLHILAVLWAVCALILWTLLGRRTGSGFPLIFDLLALLVFLISVSVLLFAIARWLGFNSI